MSDDTAGLFDGGHGLVDDRVGRFGGVGDDDRFQWCLDCEDAEEEAEE